MQNEQLRDYVIFLKEGQPQYINQSGNHFHIQKSSTEIKLKFDNNNEMTRKQGQGNTLPSGYERVELSSNVEQQVIITLGTGTTTDAGAGANIGAVNATIEVPNQYFIQALTLSGGTNQQLLSASSTNRQMIVSVPSDAACGVLIHDDPLLLDDGFLLEVGQSLDVVTTGAVFAKSETGATVRVNRIATRFTL